MPQKLEKITELDLRMLPRWARVALAARCARTVQPLFHRFRPNEPEEDLTALEIAIGIAEATAGSGRRGTSLAEAAAAAHRAAGRAIHQAAKAGSAEVNAAPFIGWAVAHAAGFAAEAAEGAETAGVGAAAVVAAFSCADDAARVANATDTRASLRRDVDRLHESAVAEGWTDMTPVAVDFFEPL